MRVFLYPWKKLFLFSCLFFALSFAIVKAFKKDTYRYQLAVIAIFQNEERFLKEWLDFYRVQGVEHFYLFNHLSEDNYEEVLKPYLKARIVELHDWPYRSQPGNEAEWTKIQAAAYRRGLDLARGQAKWVALLDTDEFMFSSQAKNLVHFLKDYEECSGILVNWQLFGTSHVARIPEYQFMIEALVMQSPIQTEVNTYCKSLVRPEKVKYCLDPHSVIYYPWSYSLDPNKNIFRWKFHKHRPVLIDKIRINHYWSRDEEFFYTHKLARYKNWGNAREACLQRNQEANQMLNQDILFWLPSIRQLQHNDLILFAS